MITVRDILRAKGNQIWSVSPDATVFSALELMAEKNTGALVALDGESLAGIFSERDYARKVILKGKASKETSVREIMTSEVTTVRPSQSVDECMALMTDKRIRHLPVFEEDKLVGLISIGDVVKAVISEREFVIKQLESYITGGP
ncbi:MAG: CBS domain-containing protein [Deltaproteobacteria bacterium]|nr:CBS domain-containing protein [Deltaproteobacteria bacterium]MBI2540100.1 CBS domain-containing protein [Deltaproteobacteria bacterium]